MVPGSRAPAAGMASMSSTAVALGPAKGRMSMSGRMIGEGRLLEDVSSEEDTNHKRILGCKQKAQRLTANEQAAYGLFIKASPGTVPRLVA